MKTLNQHIDSLSPRRGAEGNAPVHTVIDGKEAWYAIEDYCYLKKIVCWADDARFFNFILKNTGADTAKTYFRVVKDGKIVSHPSSFTLQSGEERAIFARKQIYLQKNDCVEFYSDKTTISLLANCSYLSGYEWFHLRVDFAAGQVEYIGPGMVRASSLSVNTESRMPASLRSAQLAAQAEYTDSKLRNAAAKIQVEYTV